MSERPRAGTRWKRNDCGCILTAGMEPYMPKAWPDATVTDRRYVCLKNPGLTHLAVSPRWGTLVEEEPAKMEAGPRGWPARCLRCGGDKGGLAYMCSPCWGPEDVPGGGLPESLALMQEWQAGARDFPRRAVPAAEPAAAAPEEPSFVGPAMAPVLAANPYERDPDMDRPLTVAAIRAQQIMGVRQPLVELPLPSYYPED